MSTENGNLVLRRREGQILWIGTAKVEVVVIENGVVSLAINAPRETKILREEIRPLERTEAVALLESARTGDEWNASVDRIQSGYKGEYPSFWIEAVIESGLFERVSKRLDAGTRSSDRTVTPDAAALSSN